MSGIFIVAAKRTPFGKFGGSLKNKSITDLSEIAFKAALAQAGNIATFVLFPFSCITFNCVFAPRERREARVFSHSRQVFCP